MHLVKLLCFCTQQFWVLIADSPPLYFPILFCISASSLRSGKEQFFWVVSRHARFTGKPNLIGGGVISSCSFLTLSLAWFIPQFQYCSFPRLHTFFLYLNIVLLSPDIVFLLNLTSYNIFVPPFPLIWSFLYSPILIFLSYLLANTSRNCLPSILSILSFPLS